MAGNPLVPQGTLNRVRASINFSDNPQLNITASFLGKEGINSGFDGDQTLAIPTMSGIVTSPEPYQIMTVTAHLLRSQNLANIFFTFIQNSTICGDFIVTPDSSAFPPVYVNNGFIKTNAAMLLNGTQADFTIELGGFFVINNALWAGN
jgi:hypothetical protein